MPAPELEPRTSQPSLPCFSPNKRLRSTLMVNNSTQTNDPKTIAEMLKCSGSSNSRPTGHAPCKLRTFQTSTTQTGIEWNAVLGLTTLCVLSSSPNSQINVECLGCPDEIIPGCERTQGTMHVCSDKSQAVDIASVDPAESVIRQYISTMSKFWMPTLLGEHL